MSQPFTVLRVCVLLMLASAARFAWAETVISGTLTDPRGRPVAGGTIRLFHRSGALVTDTNTDETGHFSFVGVASGEYRVAAAALGLTTISKDLVLVADQTVTADMQFGAVQPQSQSVVITAKALEPTLDLRNSEVNSEVCFSNCSTRVHTCLGIRVLLGTVSDPLCERLKDQVLEPKRAPERVADLPRMAGESL